MFEIEYEFREEDLVHFNEMRLKNDPEMQKNIRKSRLLVPGAMLLIGMFYYVYYADMTTTAYIAILAIGWGIVSPYVMKMDMRRQFLEKYTVEEKAGMFGMHTLKIEQDYLAEKSPGGKHKTYWKDMLRVDYIEKYVHIFIELDSAIIIPVETVKSGDLEKFAEQAESMIERLG
ncbi:MAG: YcxB family protein [Methylococcaceae bacterium]|nr:YcxB family protein [Methylococcaceae bacterium]